MPDSRRFAFPSGWSWCIHTRKIVWLSVLVALTIFQIRLAIITNDGIIISATAAAATKKISDAILPWDEEIQQHDNANNNGTHTSSSALLVVRKREAIPKFEPPRRQFEVLTYTQYGWFHPDIKTSSKAGRVLVSKDFAEAVQAHKLFNATAWPEFEAHPDPNQPIIAFLDIETCLETNWPHLGGNADTVADSSHKRSKNTGLQNVCEIVQQALASPAVLAPESRLVVLSCGADNPRFACGRRERNQTKYAKLVVAHLSASSDQVADQDIGIPPLPIRPAHLTPSQVEDIESCRAAEGARRHLFSFAGRERTTFPEFMNYFEPLHDGRQKRMGNATNLVYARFHVSHYERSKNTNNKGGKLIVPLSPEEQDRDSFYNTLKDSLFAGAPRGDNLYSYRFSEVLSAGAIPVVYANGWVLPYTADVVNWTDAAVLLPQEKVNQTMDILRGYTSKDICRMQNKALEVYRDYVADSHGRVRGIVKALDARMDRPLSTHQFLAAPGSVITQKRPYFSFTKEK